MDISSRRSLVYLILTHMNNHRNCYFAGSNSLVHEHKWKKIVIWDHSLKSQTSLSHPTHSMLYIYSGHPLKSKNTHPISKYIFSLCLWFYIIEGEIIKPKKKSKLRRLEKSSEEKRERILKKWWRPNPEASCLQPASQEGTSVDNQALFCFSPLSKPETSTGRTYN